MMLVTNNASIESKVRDVLEKKGKGGWLRASECAKLFAKGDASLETKFYRWRKQVGKNKVSGFQAIKLAGNISFIGLDSADPKVIESFVSENKKILQSVKSGYGVFEWLERRAERKEQQRKKRRRELEAEREAITEIINFCEECSQEKEWEIRKKWKKLYGLD